MDLSYYPGRLEQTYELDDLTIHLALIFVSNRTALIQTTLENTGEEPLSLGASWTGAVFDKIQEGTETLDIGTRLTAKDNDIQVNFGEVRERGIILLRKTQNIRFIMRIKFQQKLIIGIIQQPLNQLN